MGDNRYKVALFPHGKLMFKFSREIRTQMKIRPLSMRTLLSTFQKDDPARKNLQSVQSLH